MIKKDKYFKLLKIHKHFLSKKDIYKNKTMNSCPKCSGDNYIKYGSYKEIQRYKCKDCGKTFSKTTNCLWSYSKKEPIKWIKFVEYILERKSLRFCAEKLEISLVTAFYWRHKVLHGLAFDDVPDKLSGDVHINKKLIPENFKGSRKIASYIRHNIWVVGAKDSKDSMIAKPISRGFWDLQSFNKKIYNIIDKKSYLVSYEDRYIFLVAKTHNKKRIKEVKCEKKIKFFSSSLGKWLKKYCGVATKYLEKYLTLFILCKIKKRVNYIRIFEKLIVENRFIKVAQIGFNQECLTN